MFYNNDIESMHHVEKMDLCYKTVGVIELINALKEFRKGKETKK